MATEKVEIFQHTCQHCGHVWKTERERPGVCPKCKTYRWDQPPAKPWSLIKAQRSNGLD